MPTTTALSYHNLAYCLEMQGKLVPAELLYRQALEARRKVLGENHPRTAISYNSVAVCLQSQRKHTAALELLRPGVRSYEAARQQATMSGLDNALFSVSSPYPFLAALLARSDQVSEAWQALESYFGRGLLAESAAQRGSILRAEENQQRQLLQQRARLESEIVPLIGRRQLPGQDRFRLDGLLQQRRGVESQLADLAVVAGQRLIAPFAEVQSRLPADAALLAWVDVNDPIGKVQEHWACVVRSTGRPVWVKLPGTGPEGSWIDADNRSPRKLRQELLEPSDTLPSHLAAVTAQRLHPVEPHLQGIRRLIVLPAGTMSALPIEALSDRWTISYAASATLYARRKPPSNGSLNLLAIGDPLYREPTPTTSAASLPPDHGVLLTLVVPDGGAAKGGLQAGDVMLRYGDTKLTQLADLKIRPDGAPVPVQAWRDGRTMDLKVAPGRLGVQVSPDPAAKAIASSFHHGMRCLGPPRLRDFRPDQGYGASGLITSNFC